MVAMRAEADRALAEERLRADRLSELVDAGRGDLDAPRAVVQAAQKRADGIRQARTTRGR
jgi:hypothetical protein